jgi:hypothetical protein
MLMSSHQLESRVLDHMENSSEQCDAFIVRSVRLLSGLPRRVDWHGV